MGARETYELQRARPDAIFFQGLDLQGDRMHLLRGMSVTWWG